MTDVPVNFDVSTPLREHEWCQSPEEVGAAIDRYMTREPQADIAKVRVVEFSTRESTAIGHDRNPHDFWHRARASDRRPQ